MFLRRSVQTLKKAPFVWDPISTDQIRSAVKDNSIVSWGAQKAWNPAVCVKQEGNYYIDDKGRKLFDGNSGLMCSNTGHTDPRVIETVHQAMKDVDYLPPGWASEWRARACLEMKKVTPPNTHYFFCLSGAEANENAIRMARLHTKRHKIIVRSRTYHGASNLTLNCTGDYRRWGASEVTGLIRVRDAFPYRCPLRRPEDDDAAHSARLLEDLEFTIRQENPDAIAAMLIEPVVGTNGIIVPPKGYLEGVRALTKKYGILLICDEVMTGVGRTGKFWAHQYSNIVPDIITSAKGITSAYLPLGATIVSDEIYQSFAEKPYIGGLTYMSHPVCMASCAAALRIMREDKVVEHVDSLQGWFNQRMKEIGAKHKSVGDARSIGFFSCFEIVADQKTKAPLAPYPQAHPAFAQYQAACLEDGLMMYANGGNGVLLFIPPLTSTKEELDNCFNILDKNLAIFDKVVQ